MAVYIDKAMTIFGDKTKIEPKRPGQYMNGGIEEAPPGWVMVAGGVYWPPPTTGAAVSAGLSGE